MRVVIFCHSLVSDWNHGNAHFLRGVASEFLRRGCQVDVYEPVNAWSLQNLLADHGTPAIDAFHRAYPQLNSIRYRKDQLDFAQNLAGADLVLVHEWNDPDVVAAIGRARVNGNFRLLFHDTHHRSITEPSTMQAFDLTAYDGVLAFGQVIRDIYLQRGWAKKAWTWHEAADHRVFRPLLREGPEIDLVWIGNWGDNERVVELYEFLIEPVRRLRLRARVYGVRYPKHALDALRNAGIEYRGWLPNFEAPRAYAQARVTVHVPRRPYARALPGVPTIRVFEALACGIPLISAPWQDSEHLFNPGNDYLLVRSGDEMSNQLDRILTDRAHAAALAEHGLRTVTSRHTCAHRVDELLRLHTQLQSERDIKLA